MGAHRPWGGPAGDALITHLLYLHGFRSSPRSTKAQQVAAWVARERPDLHWWCPRLPPSPRAAMAMVFAHLAAWPADGMAVIGSSLGGFYAGVVQAQTGCPAVLLNPAVHPSRDLARYIGEQTTFHDPAEHFYFRAEFIDELRVLERATLAHPEHCMAIVAKGDEVLDWREMAAFCARAQLTLIDGGDHALSDFATRLPAVTRFFGL